ncbi:hypothetical protein [Tateyamaria sp. SN6-1]|uniref:hypothetical protein n=1 Tax=Tateyamaria sp. SN6-1 TaxID=3092148 RepID=UPI0039F58709
MIGLAAFAVGLIWTAFFVVASVAMISGTPGNQPEPQFAWPLGLAAAGILGMLASRISVQR